MELNPEFYEIAEKAFRKNTKVRAFSLSIDLSDKLDDLSVRENRPKSWIVSEALSMYFGILGKSKSG